MRRKGACGGIRVLINEAVCNGYTTAALNERVQLRIDYRAAILRQRVRCTVLDSFKFGLCDATPLAVAGYSSYTNILLFWGIAQLPLGRNAWKKGHTVMYTSLRGVLRVIFLFFAFWTATFL